MKLSEKINARGGSRPFYTFEFFPPRTNQGFENLVARISRLATLDPLAISVTWGAGGSTKDRSLELAGITQSHPYSLATMLHLTCTNMQEGLIDDVLESVKDRGIQNILALRGDPPRGKEEWIPSDPRFTHAIDLVRYIRSVPEYSSHFCIGVAGYPDGHPDSPLSEDAEIDNLKAKVDAGADFIITQLFYDVDQFLRWVKKVRAKGITVPIIPGIMPVQTYATFARLTKLCGTKVPKKLEDELTPLKHDDRLVKDYGVNYAIEMIRKIHSDGDIQGFHFCTLNLEKSVQRVLEGLQWTGAVNEVSNKLIADIPAPLTENSQGTEFLITPSSAANNATSGLVSFSKTKTKNEMGKGEVNDAASWDDFPNGRFGDFKSPAFGNQDPWGGSGMTRTDIHPQWANPKSSEDLTRMFMSYLESKITTTPFSDGALCPESVTILPQLKKLTQRGWWTVGSQPAVDGISSADETFGWGPRSGWVFQKAFVEFFCDGKDADAIEAYIAEKGQGWVHYFMANGKGDFRGNVAGDGRNAVTWGIFPGSEILQSTIIERESFITWKEEAFSIWKSWASFYRPASPERQLLDEVAKERWLVSIIHHDYKNADALWTFLFDSELGF
ncbi:methylenetetrahydrofolate reductase-domain-containing protein [Ephemerocybe angulata]|uniref:Methylenetetrahydrofolate reductase-domain-containing protein n=1 Tax=Ephemerocybe angulata TaxID=980116 RepID=A0A8H6IE69_9AGAR|nr:methylenetetrahydrofolate reductase-domain-containing protein [Tulosesus angulatus]